jgi:Protein of unknown function (DUF2789)
MDPHHHDLDALFAQLGLVASPSAIETFVRLHRPLPDNVKLAEAPFWSPTQAAFLRETVKDDADWAQVVDSLDAMMRRPPPTPAVTPAEPADTASARLDPHA